MKKCVLLFQAILLFTPCFNQTVANTYYLEHIAIVDVLKGSLLPDRTITVSDSMISAVVPSGKMDLPGGAKVINCRGKFIIPGLWDMHVHLGNATASALPVFLANGITGVRDMGTRSFDSILEWRRQISSGQLNGPRIISPGPILNGGHNLPDFQLSINTAEEAEFVVDSLVKIGVDFIKVHAGLSRENYYAIAQACAKHHTSFAGHIPASNTGVLVTGEEASEAGQRSLEHMLGIPFARDTIQAFQHMYPSPESLLRLFAALLMGNTYVTPTLTVYHVPADYQGISAKQDPLLKYVATGLRSFWQSQTGDWPQRNKEFMNWLLNARANMIPALKEAGIPLLAGTDTGFPFVLPGFGLHQELGYLVAAGLSPFEAIQTATINPARFLGRLERSGTVEKGKLADLVILNADPTIQIENLGLIEAVIMNGKMYDRSALDHELKLVAEKLGTTSTR